MIKRSAIDAAIHSILGRHPEEAAYSRCQAAFADINDLIENLIASEEFKTLSWHLAAATARTQIAQRTSWHGVPADIEWAYTTFLGRFPESYAVITEWMLHCKTKEDVVEKMILSQEFKSNAWHAAAKKIRTQYGGSQDNVSPALNSNDRSKLATSGLK